MHEKYLEPGLGVAVQQYGLSLYFWGRVQKNRSRELAVRPGVDIHLPLVVNFHEKLIRFLVQLVVHTVEALHLTYVQFLSNVCQ